MPREVDPFRRHVEVVTNKWKCKFCGKDFGGSATRIRALFAGVPGYGIKLCERVDEHVRSEALKAMRGKSVADAINRGGASIEVTGRRSDGMGQIVVLGSDHPSSHHDMQNSNRSIPQQPSFHWQNGIQRLNDERGNEKTSSLQQPSTDLPASIFLDPSQLPELFDQSIDLETRYEQQNSRMPSPLQNHQSLNNSVTNGLHQSTKPGVAVPGPPLSGTSTIGTPGHSNQTHSGFDEHWRDESASYPQISSAEWMSYLLDMPYPEEMQMSDLQNRTGPSSSQNDQSLHGGTSNCLQDCNQIPIAEVVPLSNATSLTNAVKHFSQQPLLLCDEERENETSSFSSQASMDISPPSASQPSTGPCSFEKLVVDSLVSEGGTNTEDPLSSLGMHALK